jgi:hypothetical protein
MIVRGCKNGDAMSQTQHRREKVIAEDGKGTHRVLRPTNFQAEGGNWNPGATSF